jgi:hypothetical protein
MATMKKSTECTDIHEAWRIGKNYADTVGLPFCEDDWEPRVFGAIAFVAWDCDLVPFHFTFTPGGDYVFDGVSVDEGNAGTEYRVIISKSKADKYPLYKLCDFIRYCILVTCNDGYEPEEGVSGLTEDDFND